MAAAIEQRNTMIVCVANKEITANIARHAKWKVEFAIFAAPSIVVSAFMSRTNRIERFKKWRRLLLLLLLFMLRSWLLLLFNEVVEEVVVDAQHLDTMIPTVHHDQVIAAWLNTQATRKIKFSKRGTLRTKGGEIFHFTSSSRLSGGGGVILGEDTKTMVA